MPYNTFSDGAVKRISQNVKWGEGVRKRGDFNAMIPFKPQSEEIYVQLMVKDEDDYGYWKAEEVKLTNGSWVILDNGRKFNGTDYPYIRHVNWEDANLKAIVKVFQVQDIESEDKPYIWVFEEELTNPEAFIFYADSTGNTGQSTGADTWTMTKGGTVYTNNGEMDIPDGYQMPAGKTAYAKITFINFLGDWFIASAEMTIEAGDYWEDNGSTLIVRVKIASTEIKKDICRLTQHHAGDIRFELFKNVTVSSGNPWIGVVNNNNNYVVSHLLPYGYPQDDFLAMMGGCPDVPKDTFENFIEWFITNLVHLKYDQLGHIYEREECYDGIVEDYTDDEDDEDDDGNKVKLAGNLTAPLFASTLQPWAIAGTDGFVPTYTVLNGAKNYTDFVGVNDVMLFATNSNNQIVKISDVIPALTPDFQVNKVAKASNVNGTSGFSASHMYLDTKNFRFNDTLTIKAGIVNKGLPATVINNTAPCTTTISATLDVRDYEDPNVTEQTVQVTSSVAGVGTAGYSYEVDFKYSDGTPVSYRLGFNKPFLNEPSTMAIGGGGSTSETSIDFDLKSTVAHGDAIKMTAKLFYLHDDVSKTYANSDATKLLYVAIEQDCLTDANGDKLTDSSGECYTAPRNNIPFVNNDTYHIKAVTSPFYINSPTVGIVELLSEFTNIFNNVSGNQLTKKTLTLDTGGPYQHTVRISGPNDDLDIRVESGYSQPYISGNTTNQISYDSPVDSEPNTYNTIFYIRRSSQGESPW